MALQKTIIKNNGIEMNYHRITGVDLMVETNSNDEDNLRLTIRDAVDC